MTEPQVKTIKRKGSRFYVHPSSNEKFIGVTSVIRMLPKPFLQYWAAKMVAESAVENIGAVMNLISSGDKSAAVDMLKRAPTRSSGAAADTGTQLHAIAEQLNKGEDVGLVHPDLSPSVDQYKKFLDDWQPEFLEAEATAFNYDDKWAGTLDGICKIGGESIIFDLKTGKGVYDEVSLQLTAYANATCLVDPDGKERALPEIEGGAVLHLRPDHYELIPVRIGDDIYRVFQSLIHITEWDSEIKQGVLGTPQKLGEN